MKLKRLRFSRTGLLLALFGMSLLAVSYLALWAPVTSARFERLDAPKIPVSPLPAVPAVQTSEQIISIPVLGINETIHDGATEQTLDKGVWRMPQTSTPDKAGNTVLAGHRTLNYSRPGIFFHFDKLAAGDDILIQWHGQRYHYRVAKIFTVPPSAIEITRPTSVATLTMYTCTPVWTSAKRLVVQAELVQ